MLVAVDDAVATLSNGEEVLISCGNTAGMAYV
jgi:hypothetical protein